MVRALLPMLTFVAMLGGCFGWPSSVADSGLPASQVGGYCTAGNTIAGEVLAPAGVRIALRASKDKLRRTILLGVTLLIPPGVSVRLVSPVVWLQSPDWTAPRSLNIHHIAGRGALQYPPGAVLTGTQRPADNVYAFWYAAERATIEPQTNVPQASAFTVRLPALEIDGEVFQAEPVAFAGYRTRGLFRCGP